MTPCYAIKPLSFLPLPYKDNLSESECTFTTGIHSNLPEDFDFLDVFYVSLLQSQRPFELWREGFESEFSFHIGIRELVTQS